MKAKGINEFEKINRRYSRSFRMNKARTKGKMDVKSSSQGNDDIKKGRKVRNKPESPGEESNGNSKCNDDEKDEFHNGTRLYW